MPSLVTLTPQFNPANHSVYRDLVIHAIDHDPQVTNLALTGGYGVGKSSVLRDVAAHYGAKVVELSLASLAAAPVEHPSQTADSGTATAATPTNRIQREIVKQLLYRLPPSKTPQSRFPRATRPEPSITWSIRSGTLLFALLTGTGLATTAVKLTTDQLWHQVVSYAFIYAAAIAIMWVLRANSRRLTVDSVSAGPAKVTLSTNSTSYFDEYLDEIVYYFEVSGCEIVLLEDIDRFGDPHIFETLRALNTLLNGAEQLTSPVRHPANTREHLRALLGLFKPEPNARKIVFVYAIHDSVFERLTDRETNNEDSDQVSDLARIATRSGEQDLELRDIQLALGQESVRPDRIREQVERANRTKFFDLVIPMVPFITANNARDVLKRTMGEAGRSLSPDLIKLVARHLADMRLVLNIRNEFEVYRHQLYAVPQKMHGMTEDHLFALIVYKNTHLGDFEAIRLQSSRLDSLYRLWRRLINAELFDANTRLHTAQAMLDKKRQRAKRAIDLGEQLLTLRDTLVTASGQYGGPLSSIFIDDHEVAEDEVRSTDFWHAVDKGEPVTFGPPGTRSALTFTAGDLASLMGSSRTTGEWLETETPTYEADLQTARRDVWFLRHHTWKQLYATHRFSINLETGAPASTRNVATFRQICERVLSSKLACDLVRDGFIDENFALYVSTFYGEHLRPAATEYLMRCVRTGEADVSFLLNADDVDAIINEEGDAVLRDPSMYNVSILDHLLGRRLSDASHVANELLKWGELERTFFDWYLSQGKHPDKLVRLTAPSWPQAFVYLSTESPVDPATRVRLFDVALQEASTDFPYVLDTRVREFIEDNYLELNAIVAPKDAAHAHASFAIVEAAGCSLASTLGLNVLARAEVIVRRSYSVTAENLAYLADRSNIALDTLLDANRALYTHSLRHLPDYLDAVRASDKTTSTVSSPGSLAGVVSDIVNAGFTRHLPDFLALVSPQYAVPSLESVPASSWPALCASGRTLSTFSNIIAYIDEFDIVDDSLATLLRLHSTVECHNIADADRVTLATAIANASITLPGVRLRTALIRSLDCQIPAVELEPTSGALVASLLRGRLIADDAGTFAPRLMRDWSTLEAAIRASKKFESFVSPAILPAKFIPSLLSSEVRLAVKVRVVSNLPIYLSDAPASTGRRVAEALVAHRWRLSAALIDAARASGAGAADVVRLLGQAAERVTTAELRSTLRGLPAPYRLIADPGGYRPVVPDDEQHRAVLDRLVAARVVKSHKPDPRREGYRKVSTYRR